MCIPDSIVASFTHDIFIKGCQVNFSLDKPTDLEATSLYPEMQFRTIDECFDEFVEKIMGGQAAAEKAAGKEGIVILFLFLFVWALCIFPIYYLVTCYRFS